MMVRDATMDVGQGPGLPEGIGMRMVDEGEGCQKGCGLMVRDATMDVGRGPGLPKGIGMRMGDERKGCQKG